MAIGGNFIVECNEAARRCSQPEFRAGLLYAAGLVHVATERLHKERSIASMQDCVAAWTLASKTLALLPPEGDPAPLGGDTYPALLQLQNVA